MYICLNKRQNGGIKLDIDRRIKIIMDKMEKLQEKDPEFSCGEFPPEWNKPVKEERVAKFEEKYGIRLPEDYRRFITTVADGGSQPFYGFYSLSEGRRADYSDNVDISGKFPCTVRKPFDIYKVSDEEYDEFAGDKYSGFLFLCHEGCGMYSILVVNSDDKDTYGTVWYYDFANDAGMFPLINPVTGKTMDFLDWLEYYADKTYGLEDDDFFSYGEIAGYLPGTEPRQD